MALPLTRLNLHTDMTPIPTQYMKRDFPGSACMLTEGLNAVITVTSCLFAGSVRQVGLVIVIT